MEAKKHASARHKKELECYSSSFFLGALSLGLLGFDFLLCAEVRSPRKHWVSVTVHEWAAVSVFDDQRIDSNATIVALANWRRRDFHVEEVSACERLSFLDVGERDHC